MKVTLDETSTKCINVNVTWKPSFWIHAIQDHTFKAILLGFVFCFAGWLQISTNLIILIVSISKSSQSHALILKVYFLVIHFNPCSRISHCGLRVEN